MNKNKEMLAIKLNLEFDEVVSLFSEETLSSMEQDELLGGVTNAHQCYCTVHNTTQHCGSTNNTNVSVGNNNSSNKAISCAVGWVVNAFTSCNAVTTPAPVLVLPSGPTTTPAPGGIGWA